MSVGSVTKRCGCIILSASVISPSSLWYKSAVDCVKMLTDPLFRSGEENENVIRNPRADPNHHKKSTTSRGSPLARACQVWSTSVSTFVSYPVYRMTERSYNLRPVGGGNNNVLSLLLILIKQRQSVWQSKLISDGQKVIKRVKWLR